MTQPDASFAKHPSGLTQDAWLEVYGVQCAGGCGRKTVERLHGVSRCEACEKAVADERREAKRLRSIPEAFRWSTFAAAELPRRSSAAAVEVAKASVLLPRVVIVGPAGEGKTSLVCAMMRAWLDRGHNGHIAHFCPAWRLGLARSQYTLGHGEPEEVENALRAHLTVLDDAGSERQTPTNAVPDVIFERHAAARAMWVTTAMSQEAMAARYGDGIARRVFEGARLIELGAK